MREIFDTAQKRTFTVYTVVCICQKQHMWWHYVLYEFFTK